MTLGELADALQDLRDAQQAVQDCRDALLHGGNPQTMRDKREALERAEDWVERARNKELPL